MLIKVGTWEGEGVWLESSTILAVQVPITVGAGCSVKTARPNGSEYEWHITEGIDDVGRLIRKHQLAEAAGEQA